jgi:hypothetical protein
MWKDVKIVINSVLDLAPQYNFRKD